MASFLALPFKFCVVGSGPGGMYATKYLLKALSNASVDVYESLPAPYGLVRYGVAPDHPEVKSVQNDFDQVMADGRVKYFGNIALDKNVSLEELRRTYDGVILSYGASFERFLQIPGEENFSNIFGARTFVNWYNGHPNFKDFKPDLNGETAVVIGQGNVAIDCARILCKSVDELAQTDIADHALEVLASSKIKDVQVVGRRGHVQAAFTMKELRELTKIDDVGCVVYQSELERGLTPASLEEIEQSRPKRRMNELLKQISSESNAAQKCKRRIHLRFLLSPREIVGRNGKVDKVVFDKTRLAGKAEEQSSIPTGDEETLDSSLLLRSIGYKSLPVPGLPFDFKKNTVLNELGRVIFNPETSTSGLANVYASGWLKRGPSGIIGTNITDARETVAAIVEDVTNGKLVAKPESNTLPAQLFDVLKGRGCKIVDWEGWKRIEQEEFRRGQAKRPPKPREKIVKIDEMLQIAGCYS